MRLARKLLAEYPEVLWKELFKALKWAGLITWFLVMLALAAFVVTITAVICSEIFDGITSLRGVPHPMALALAVASVYLYIEAMVGMLVVSWVVLDYLVARTDRRLAR